MVPRWHSKQGISNCCQAATSAHERDGWCKAVGGRPYIYPKGFTTSTVWKSSVHLDQLCEHVNTIVVEGGSCWPLPTFRVTAEDRPNEPIDSILPSACWKKVGSLHLLRLKSSCTHLFELRANLLRDLHPIQS